MIVEIHHEGKRLQFSRRSVSRQNLFTIVVGKNGTGKSRLLRSIIEILAEDRVSKAGRALPRDTYLSTTRAPTNIVAVSTSPFDKFPLPIRSRVGHGYSYLGLKGLNSQNLSLSFLVKTIHAVITAVVIDPHRAKRIAGVLDYLDYSALIEIEFAVSSSPIPIHRGDLDTRLVDFSKTGSGPGRSYYRGSTLGRPHIPASKVKDVDRCIKRLFQHIGNKKRLKVHLNESGVFNPDPESMPVDKDFAFLVEIGVLRLANVNLSKHSSGERFRIKDASSGEQSIVMSFLGIASQIQDGALICIDEPEICLHPEWQEKYIELLIWTFRDFQQCHFVIATHSPQIVSRLSDRNSYVLNLENGTTTPGSAINKRSIDFQLANTFYAPGFKNEYLTRELLSILVQVGKDGVLSQGQLSLAKRLLSLKDHIDDADPVRELMLLTEKAIREAAQ